MADGIALRFDAYTSGPNIGTPAYTAADERQLSTVLAGPGGALLARAGVRPGPGGAVSVGGSPEGVTVQPFTGIITDPAGGGSYIFVIPAAVKKDFPTRPGVGNSRIDELVVKILNDGPRPADGAREVDLELRTGTAGASPVSPGVPTGQLRIRQLAVPSSGTILPSLPPPRIAGLGGVIPVADTTERDAIDSLYDSLIVYREDAGLFEGRAGGLWVPLNPEQQVWKSADESVTSSTTLQNDDHLVLPLAANARYLLDGYLSYTGPTFAAGPADLKADWAIPSGASVRWSHNGPGSNTPNGIAATETNHSTAHVLGTYGTGTNITSRPAGWVTTGSTAGNLQLRWAQNVSNGTPVTMRAGSWIKLKRVA